MGMQIIKQPDGKFAVFDGMSNTFSLVDSTEQEVIDLFIRRAKERAERETRQWLDEVKADRCYPKPMTWKKALATHRRNKANTDNEGFNKYVENVARKLGT